jgi:hypothetical protein
MDTIPVSKLAAFTAELIGTVPAHSQLVVLELNDDGLITNPDAIEWQGINGNVIGVAISNELIQMRIELGFGAPINATPADKVMVQPNYVVIQLKSGGLSNFLFDYINGHALTVEQLEDEYTID